jgi:ribose transport system substrate-binding protein
VEVDERSLTGVTASEWKSAEWRSDYSMVGVPCGITRRGKGNGLMLRYSGKPAKALGTGSVVAIIASSVVILAACGSDAPRSTGTGHPAAPGANSASSSIAAAVAEAKAEFSDYTKTQPPIAVPTLPKRPPRGKTIAVMNCPTPACALVADPAIAAAKLLGWTVDVVSTAITPEGYTSALHQIVQKRPDYAVLTPFVPNSVVSTELAQLQSDGTKVVEISGGQTPSATGPVEGVTSGSPELAESGRLMADAIVANSGPKPQVGFVWDPSLASGFDAVKSAFTSVIAAAGGSVTVLAVSIANIGTSVPGQVVSFEQSHPGLKYLAFAISDFLEGVPEAFAAAGLQSVKMISRAPDASTMAAVASGTEWATVGEEEAASGWRAIDQLAMLSEGQALGAESNPVGWHQIFVKNNVPAGATTAPNTPGTPSAFLRAWHI